MNKVMFWLLKKLLSMITEQAIITNDHVLADNVIVIDDALDEIKRRLIK